MCAFCCIKILGLSVSVTVVGSLMLYDGSSVREREKFSKFFFNIMSLTLAVPRA